MAELLFTTDAFRPFGVPAPAVPMILDCNMRLVEPACAWLMHVALVRGRTRSPQTWRTYGEALYDWWQTLEASRWRWDGIGLGEIAAYRNAMLAKASPATGRPLSRATINGRLRIVGLFYRWAAAHGAISRSPFVTVDVTLGQHRPSGWLAHVDAHGGVQMADLLTLRHKPELPRALTPQTVRAVMRQMSARDRLIVEWAALTGMRRLEIAGLRLDQLSASQDQTFEQLPVVPVRIDVTKGGKVRHVYPPLPLIDRTWAYIREERDVAARRARSRTGSQADPRTVFITCAGRQMTSRRIGAMFAEAAHAAGVKATFHGLRHTFAGVMLRFLQRQSNTGSELNPLLTVQTLLGHADLTTTGLYLKMLATDLAGIEQTVDDLYAAMG